MPYYKIPDEYFFRLHHPRPRFKNDIEQVLIYMATEIVELGQKPASEFIRDLDNAIRRYPGNLGKTAKTIANWRTEIDALFCFVEQDGGLLGPSNRAIQLEDEQDLVKFFKLFCYYFQYPGGFVKPERNLEFLQHGINFRPASYILQMLSQAEKNSGRRAGISKAEATHCIFNDLRVTRDQRPVKTTWELICKNRENGVEYDSAGDIIRYAGDILDYMVQANLLARKHNNFYYINHNEDIAIQRFINPVDDFNYYTKIRDVRYVNLERLRELDVEWSQYFNTVKDDGFFDTDLLALITDTPEEYEELKASVLDIERLIEEEATTTGGIGSVGESLVLNHEKKRITIEGRPDLTHLVVLIPTVFKVGYDINSVEVDERKRLVEVKTTASSTPVNFMRFHLTPNEWNAAESFGERYHVYRLMVTKGMIKLFVIPDPVGEYKHGNLSASPRNGMDVIFDPRRCGYEAELLI